MVNSVKRMRNSKSRKSLLKKMTNRVRKMSNKVRSLGRKIRNKTRKNLRKNLRKIRSNKRNKKMKGGAIDYVPLPCDANRNTDWNSTQQVGHESCVQYGTDGAEADTRASALGADLSRKDITQTIKDVVDQELKAMANSVDELVRNNVVTRDDAAAARAAEIVEARLAATATTATTATTAASE